MCLVWLLTALTALGAARGAVNQCWEHLSCQDATTGSSKMECIQLCRPNLTAVTPVIQGNGHLQPPSPSSLPSSSSSSAQAKRSYSMERFRSMEWKPFGRKRRPIKVYTSNGVKEESAKAFPGEMRRRELAGELTAAEDEVKVAEEEQEQLHDVHEKKDSTYKMKHFRWSRPSSKRYGGFMKLGRTRPVTTAHSLQKRHQQRWTGADERAVREKKRREPIDRR